MPLLYSVQNNSQDQFSSWSKKYEKSAEKKYKKIGRAKLSPAKRERREDKVRNLLTCYPHMKKLFDELGKF